MITIQHLQDSFQFYQLCLRKHACRLRYILHQLNKGHLSSDELRQNLEYAIIVLEHGYTDSDRSIVEEDEENTGMSALGLSPDSVPNEVRDWLTSTFTQPAKIKPINRFKSVANALRLGIKFEKMFKLSNNKLRCNIPQHLWELLTTIDTWEFDVLKLNDMSEGHALKFVGFQLFNHYGFMNRFKVPTFVVEAFLDQMEAGYSKHGNPYHNLVHAADVAQATHFMISSTGLILTMTEVEVFATIFAAIIHDYEHTGHTNNFHIQSGTELAYLYNDRSVLENHHLSAAFKICKEPDTSVLGGLTKEEFKEFRNTVVEIVLATDMSTHFAQVKTMKAMLAQPESPDKIKSLSLIVHSCDISHPTRPWHLHRRWTDCVTEEFFRQGDLEKSMGLPFSPLCDRNSVHVAESQIGFIDFIVEPSFLITGDMLMKIVEPAIAALTMEENERDDGFVDSPDSSVPKASNKRIPLDEEGRPGVPQPWISLIHANKSEWQEQAAREKHEREKDL